MIKKTFSNINICDLLISRFEFNAHEKIDLSIEEMLVNLMFSNVVKKIIFKNKLQFCKG